MSHAQSRATQTHSVGDGTSPKDLKSFLDGREFETTLPGVVIAIVHGDDEPEMAARGLLREGRSAPMTVDSLMHLGSCTKAMTAVTAAILVDQGKLSFDSTIQQVLPQLASRIAEPYRQVTLQQLLNHTSGMPANAEDWWLKHDRRNLSMHGRRRMIAIENLKKPSEHPPGTHYLYSNLGYMVAGLMIEQVTDQEWEKAISELLFQPLGISTAGFGIPGTWENPVHEHLPIPWGHHWKDDELVPIQHDNAPAMGPAATVHMTVGDWSRFVKLAVQGYRVAKGKIDPSEPIALKRETWAKLFEPSGVKNDPGGYACGWLVARRGWASGYALNHSGSNTMWYCVVWAAPETERIYLIATNVSGKDVEKAADELVLNMIQWDRQR